MKKIIGFFIATAFCFATSAKAQSNRDFSSVDKQVQSLGALTTLNVARITDTLTRNFPDKTDKLRAIYYWIANHITLDPRATKNGDVRPVLPEVAIQKRVTTSLGIATLFQEMSSLANIRCLVVDGYLKFGFDDIETPADEPNHSWNVVQLGQSPDQWFYIDASCAAGGFDERLSAFTPAFSSHYFFPQKTFFNHSHHADNNSWQLDKGPKSIKSFYELPVISSAATDLGFLSISPNEGKIKTKIKRPVQFSYTFNGDSTIEKVELIIGQSRKPIKPTPMVYTLNGNTLNFSHSFEESDEYPVRVVINNRVCFWYIVDVR